MSEEFVLKAYRSFQRRVDTKSVVYFFKSRLILFYNRIVCLFVCLCFMAYQHL